MSNSDFIGLTFEELEQLRPLLSRSSYENIKKEFNRLESSASRLKGSGVYNPQYTPVNEKEYRAQNKIFKDRLDWLRTCFALMGMQNDFLTKENKRLKKENENLHSEVGQLLKDKKRLLGQLQKILGVANQKKLQSAISNDDEEDEEEKTTSKDCQGKKAKSESEGEGELKIPKKRGAPLGHKGRTRPIPDKVDKVEIIPPPCSCSECGNADIAVTRGFISKYIEDTPPVVKIVTERRYMEGICLHCYSTVIKPEALKGPPVEIGPNLAALLTLLRHQMGAPYRKLSSFSTTGLQISLTASGALGIINRISQKMEPIYKGIEYRVREQESLHADETGWRMDGQNWYLWVFCNKMLAYFHLDKSRGSKVPKSILGEDFPGVVHSDFYAAYNFLPKTQRCLFHLMGDIRDELEVSPEDKVLVQLEAGIKEIIQKGQEAKKIEDACQRAEAKRELKDRLKNLNQLDSQNQKTNTLIKRIGKYQDDLLRFLDHAEVEYHNNRAERALRHSVILRKITFGNRTPQGAYYFTTMNSVIATAQLKKINIYQFIWAIWTAKPIEIKKIVTKLLKSSCIMSNAP
ncbi:MAG: IS66 family transposase [Candidatus Aminicenantes bacterium]|nr:MAG: IS66 family transposase [Candidatus Aminicenantes bacterium]